MEDIKYDINSTDDLALCFVESPESLTESEFQQLLNNEQSVQLCRELIDCKYATIREFSRKSPNVELEWEKFAKKNRRSFNLRIFTIGGLSGMVASLLIFFAINGFFRNNTEQDGLAVFKASELPQRVTLQTSTGQSYVLNAPGNTLSAHQAGLSIRKNDSKSLAYNQQPAVGSAEMHTLTTPRGTDFKVTLSDGTTVWMNADSKLVYPATFSGKERIVQLQGEAYFEVAKDKAHPFIVQTGRLQTRVLGTQFNVNTYSPNNAHVTLIEGSVEVSNAKNRAITRIRPGEDARLSPDGTFDVKEVDVDSYVYWKDGFFYFDNVALVDIMQSLGRWYNVNVVFVNKSAMDYKMHYLCDRKGGANHAVALLNNMKKVQIELTGNTLYVR